MQGKPLLQAKARRRDVDSRLGADGLRGHANQEARKRPINSETSSACVSIAKVCEAPAIT